MSEKPKAANSAAQKELDKAEQQFEKFDQEVKAMTLDRMNAAPKQQTEGQTLLSSKEIEKAKDIYLKPSRSIGSREKFNEKFREDYNFQKEYVQFIAENNEVKGDKIEAWTKPFPGMPAEFWEIPPNKPVWGPRYLAEQIRSKCYHRLIMQNTPTGADAHGSYYGALAVDTVIQRLDARPVSQRKSVFTGASGF